ncbi:MAG: YvcK family protein [bacterium]|nr:YvcK family protein [bacterium]
MKRLKWLYPGMGIKRWFSLLAIGIFFIGVSMSNPFRRMTVFLFPEDSYFFTKRNLLFLGLGIIFVILGIRKLIKSLTSIFLPQKEDTLVDIVFENRQLKKGPRIVVIGGGTGMPVLLRGLKEYTSNISAVVTVADDGGSSGKLREGLKILPPGDIRNCLVSLADSAPLMGNLFQYRFGKDTGLDGHSFGNIFIAAMSEVTGDFSEAVKESSRVLAIRGSVIPVTLDDVQIGARMKDGREVIGESKISKSAGGIGRIFTRPEEIFPAKDALKAIEEAEVIILGPGSLYTSIIPNLLVKGIPEAIERSEAVKIYVCNIMTQPNETDGFSVGDHLQAIKDHVNNYLAEYVIVNNGVITKDILQRYKEEGAYPVNLDRKRIEKMGIKIIEDDLLTIEKEEPIAGNLIRHNSNKIAYLVLRLIMNAKYINKI